MDAYKKQIHERFIYSCCLSRDHSALPLWVVFLSTWQKPSRASNKRTVVLGLTEGLPRQMSTPAAAGGRSKKKSSHEAQLSWAGRMLGRGGLSCSFSLRTSSGCWGTWCRGLGVAGLQPQPALSNSEVFVSFKIFNNDGIANILQLSSLKSHFSDNPVSITYQTQTWVRSNSILCTH